MFAAVTIGPLKTRKISIKVNRTAKIHTDFQENNGAIYRIMKKAKVKAKTSNK
jgi:hypothetical protein